eukprot:3983136-Amphidinium_carterae.1
MGGGLRNRPWQAAQIGRYFRSGPTAGLGTSMEKQTAHATKGQKLERRVEIASWMECAKRFKIAGNGPLVGIL